MGLLDEFLSGIGETYDTLSGNERIKQRAKGYGDAFQQGLLSALPILAKQPQDITPEDAINSGLLGAIKVFHGSPHKFDAFDMSKIGTGEGNQAQGEGLYFAGAIDNAKRYAEGFGDGYQKNGGNIYEVSLEWPDKNLEAIDPLSDYHLMDYDKTLVDQTDFVRPKIEKIIRDLGIDPFVENPTGRRLIDAMFEDDLKSAGIPGLKFDAPGERRGDTSNYVIFDDKIPRIVKRNGLLE